MHFFFFCYGAHEILVPHPVMETGSLLAVKAPRVLIIGLPGNSQDFFFLVAAFFKEEKERSKTSFINSLFNSIDPN